MKVFLLMALLFISCTSNEQIYFTPDIKKNVWVSVANDELTSLLKKIIISKGEVGEEGSYGLPPYLSHYKIEDDEGETFYSIMANHILEIRKNDEVNWYSIKDLDSLMKLLELTFKNDSGV